MYTRPRGSVRQVLGLLLWWWRAGRPPLVEMHVEADGVRYTYTGFFTGGRDGTVACHHAEGV